MKISKMKLRYIIKNETDIVINSKIAMIDDTIVFEGHHKGKKEKKKFIITVFNDYILINGRYQITYEIE